MDNGCDGNTHASIVLCNKNETLWIHTSLFRTKAIKIVVGVLFN